MRHSASRIGRHPRHVYSTEGCVCGSTFNNGRTRAHVTNTAPASVQSSSQRVGALSLIPSCLGISGHPSGSRQGHLRYTGARSAGRPWVARTQFSTAVQCRNTANSLDFLNCFFIPSARPPMRRTAQNFALLFLSPAPIFALLLSLESSRGARQPENSKRAHLRVPALQTPPKFHEKTPQEKKERKLARRGK